LPGINDSNSSNSSSMKVQTDFGAEDPIWIDNGWLDTVVVVGLTCFILCLMGLSKVRLQRSVECVRLLRVAYPACCAYVYARSLAMSLTLALTLTFISLANPR
jgi:hypothetical protein